MIQNSESSRNNIPCEQRTKRNGKTVYLNYNRKIKIHVASTSVPYDLEEEQGC